MPHLIVEYTANLGPRAAMATLLEAMHAVLIAERDAGKAVFPIGAIRSRAIALEEYRVADGRSDDAFVHATLKLAAGRSAAVKARVGAALFDVMKAHFADLYAERYLALSLALDEFSEAGTYKHNNIHARYAHREASNARP